MSKIDLYKQFKICLLLTGKTIKDFADENTGTTAQHVTMVAKGEKNSTPVTDQIYKFIEGAMSDSRVREALKAMHDKSAAVADGKVLERPKDLNSPEYDW